MILNENNGISKITLMVLMLNTQHLQRPDIQEKQATIKIYRLYACTHFRLKVNVSTISAKSPWNTIQ